MELTLDKSEKLHEAQKHIVHHICRRILDDRFVIPEDYWKAYESKTGIKNISKTNEPKSHPRPSR